MKRDEPWIVQPDDDGIRPAGEPDACFYCGAKVGQPHGRDCVVPERTIVCKLAIEYTVQIPANWDTDMFEFHRNESSWCTNNALKELDGVLRYRARQGGLVLAADDRYVIDCNDYIDMCTVARVEFVREATEADEQRDGIALPRSTSRRDVEQSRGRP